MSKAGNSAGGPRLSNGSYPASDDSGPETADLDRGELPTVDEVLSRVIAEYPDRIFEPLSVTHGRKLRADCLAEPETETREVEIGERETAEVEETVRRPSARWIDALETLLTEYEGYRDRRLRMARGSEVRGDRESFLVDMDMSYSPAYQNQQYARLQAMKRQFIGGEYPNGEWCDGEFFDPVVALFGLTTSSLTPEGEYRPSVDHDREIREAWSGSSSSVKRTLRYLLEDVFGLSSQEYAWWWQSEPHPGGGDAAGYSHSHPVVIFDRAAVTNEEIDVLDPETYRPVVAKHIAECENAEWSAHRITDGEESAVSVREAGEIDDFAGYVADYIAVDPDMDLFERSPEYLLYAASQYASSTQKYSRSRWATAATNADACQQQYLDEEAKQPVEHGEAVVRSDRPGIRYECAECGSPHGIDQSEESLARKRLHESGGGSETDESGESGRTLAERWPSARSAGRVSSPVRDVGEEAETVTDGFDRPPKWEPDAVVQMASGEETEIGSPGGVRYGEVVVEGAESVTEKSPLSYLPPPSVLEGPEPWRGTSLFTERDVREGRVPPPEIVARETAEVTQRDRRVTRKEWRSDWYAERFGRESGGDCERQLPSGVSRSIEELVRVEGVESVPSVIGRLGIDPSLRGEVESVILHTTAETSA